MNGYVSWEFTIVFADGVVTGTRFLRYRLRREGWFFCTRDNPDLRLSTEKKTKTWFAWRSTVP
jgi:hypothetical protein